MTQMMYVVQKKFTGNPVCFFFLYNFHLIVKFLCGKRSTSGVLLNSLRKINELCKCYFFIKLEKLVTFELKSA